MDNFRQGISRLTKRCVIKVGSGVLSAGGKNLSPQTITRLAREISKLKKEGREIILVSSGAILAGRARLNLKPKAATTALKQALAAVGQGPLMRLWEQAFAKQKIIVAQVLLTREDFRHRERYLNARNTLFTLLRLGVIPIINENDTVAVEEIKFGDNDVLSALVSTLCDADLLVLLTDQQGLYSADPRKNPKAKLISEVKEGKAQVHLGSAGPVGSGGMLSKVRAAEMAAYSAIPAVIASGFTPRTLKNILAGKNIGTLFKPRGIKLDKRRLWLAFATKPSGQIHVDEGARVALTDQSKSLLPSGIKSIGHTFVQGDVVSLVFDGVEFARGICHYSSRELEKIKGLKTNRIENALGRKGSDEVVHSNDLVLLNQWK